MPSETRWTACHWKNQKQLSVSLKFFTWQVSCMFFSLLGLLLTSWNIFWSKLCGPKLLMKRPCNPPWSTRPSQLVEASLGLPRVLSSGLWRLFIKGTYIMTVGRYIMSISMYCFMMFHVHLQIAHVSNEKSMAFLIFLRLLLHFSNRTPKLGSLAWRPSPPVPRRRGPWPQHRHLPRPSTTPSAQGTPPAPRMAIPEASPGSGWACDLLGDMWKMIQTTLAKSMWNMVKSCQIDCSTLVSYHLPMFGRCVEPNIIYSYLLIIYPSQKDPNSRPCLFEESIAHFQDPSAHRLAIHDDLSKLRLHGVVLMVHSMIQNVGEKKTSWKFDPFNETIHIWGCHFDSELIAKNKNKRRISSFWPPLSPESLLAQLSAR